MPAAGAPNAGGVAAPSGSVPGAGSAAGGSVAGGMPAAGAPSAGGVGSVSGGAPTAGAPSAGGVGGAMPGGGAPSAGGVGSVSGGVGGGDPASIGHAPSVGGAGSVSGGISGGAPDAGGMPASAGRAGAVDTFSGGASSSGGLDGGAGGDVTAQSGTSGVRDMSNQVGRTSGMAGEESVNAQVNAPLGTTGEVIANGGGGGYVDTEVGSSQYDVQNKAGAAAHGETLQQRDVGQDLRDDAIDRSGYQDPRTSVGMAETAELESRDGRLGEVQAAQGRVSDARTAVANPVGVATSDASYAATGEAQAHVPTAAKTAQADVNVTRDATNNPEAAGEGQVDVKVQSAELEQEHKLGVHGTVGPAGSDPEKT